MKFHRYIKVFELLLTLLFFIACEENFWGYIYEAPALINTTRIKGTITDQFSGETVPAATISINDQKTMGDENGNFLLNYLLPEDAEPNKPEIGYVSVSAPQYLNYSRTLLIYPFENHMDIELEYAVPIVKNAASDGDTTQAIIVDYQGVEDIASVSVTFNKHISGNVERIEFDMVFKGYSDNITSHYQHTRRELDNYEIGSWFRITAKDKNGNVHRADFTINPDDSLLFKLVHH
jgi:hypothetical protein